MSNEESNPIEKKKLKIAIIGAGISGCSCAYFLRDMFGDKVELVVFEQSNQIGGRLETVNFKGRDYELGGSILHSSNLYMKSFVKLFDLKKRDDDKDSDSFVGFYDSKGVLLSLDGKYFGISDKFRMFKYFGLIQLIRFTRRIQAFVNKFVRIYRLQDNGFTFKNLKSLLQNLDPELYASSQRSLKKVLEADGFNTRIVNHLSNAACLSNYGQSNEIDGFVGLVSIAGTVGSLWSVNDGNKLIPIKLLEASNAKLMLNTRIKSISKSQDSPDLTNTIFYQTENDGMEMSDHFDYVVVGFPIYEGVLGKDFELNFESSKTEFTDLEMQRTNTYFINGNATKIFPELPDNKRIQLHGVDPNVAYRTVCVQLPCDFDAKSDAKLFTDKGLKLYKIFSEVDLDTSDFDAIFEKGYEVVEKMPWLAYPKYAQNCESKSIPDVVLDGGDRQRVYYLNAMEWSSSCMEISCISARNVALLIADREKGLLENKKGKQRFFNKKVLKDVVQSIRHRNGNFLLRGTCAAIAFFAVVAFGIAACIGN